MKFRLIIFLMLLPLLGIAQERGAGIRLGDPFSLTYKDFIEDYLSLEVMLGSGGVNDANYYRRSFDNNPPAPNAVFSGFSASRGVSINGRLALHEDITDMFEITQGYLLGYIGVGAQLRTTQVNYSYFVPTDNLQNTGGVLRIEDRSNVDFGPEAFVGAEYYFDEAPISVFAEIGIFLELIDRINFRGQGGIGVRYLF